MALSVGLLRKWSRRPDVTVTLIGDDEVLRFGKGGRAGRGGTVGPKIPYAPPAWVRKRIQLQQLRLAREARLKGYGR